MDTFLDRLKYLVGDEKPFKWAVKIGLDKATFSRILNNGQQPKASHLELIAERTGVSLDWLLLGKGSMRPGDQAPAYDTDEFAYVAFTTAQLAAGGGMVAHDGFLSRYAFRKEWLYKIGVDPKHAYLFIIKGDSMEPTLRESDVVLVDTDKTRVYNGRIYAINNGGDMLQIKRLERRGENLRLISDNKALYEPFEEPVKNVRVLGRAVWLGRQIAGFDEGE